MRPTDAVALVLLGSFVGVQPWIPFARPGGAATFALLAEEEARVALDRAVRWESLSRSQRTAGEIASSLAAVIALLAGFVAGTVWLSAVAGCFAIIWCADRVRRRGRAVVLEAARERGLPPSPRAHSRARLRLQRVLLLVLAVSATGAFVAYRSAGIGPVDGGLISGTLVVVATLALVGLLTSAERAFGDEEPQ